MPLSGQRAQKRCSPCPKKDRGNDEGQRFTMKKPPFV